MTIVDILINIDKSRHHNKKSSQIAVFFFFTGIPCKATLFIHTHLVYYYGERGGSVVECRTPEREVGGSKPTSTVLCPWARHFTPRKYWLITQEAVAPSRHDWKFVDWDFKPQHKQKLLWRYGWNLIFSK